MSIDIDSWLDRIAARRFADSGRLQAIERTPFEQIGSYDCERVALVFAGGRRVELFLKDYGHSRQSKDNPAERRLREMRVYRDLLEGSGLGTPELFGIEEDAAGERCLMLLEFVDADVVTAIDAGNGVAAVTWLARMQRHFLERAGELAALESLVQMDRAYFAHKLAAAERDVSEIEPVLVPRVRRALAILADRLQREPELPTSLIHGGCIPWDIVHDPVRAPGRVCVVDWELAGVGSVIYDLAVFVDDVSESLRVLLCRAYVEAARREGLDLPEAGTLRSTIDCYRQFRVVDWMSRAVEKAYTPEKLDWLVQRIEALQGATP